MANLATHCEHCLREAEPGDRECRVCGYNLVRELVVICGWCSNARDLTEAAISNGYDVTTGICPPCVAKWERDALGRIVAPAQHIPAARPEGPWNQNGSQR